MHLQRIRGVTMKIISGTLKGRTIDTTLDNFLNTMHISCYSFIVGLGIDMQARVLYFDWLKI